MKEHKSGLYYTLLTSGRLNSYLADIEEQAQERFERIVEQMKQAQGQDYRIVKGQLQMILKMDRRMSNIQTCARRLWIMR